MKFYIKNNTSIVGIILIMLLGGLSEASAQTIFLDKTPMHIFDLPNSLQGNEVQDILQDKQGYMWFASKGGVIRHDGSNFKTFSHNVTDSTSLSFNEAECFLETKDGTLWVGTWGGGLNKYNQRTESFKRFVFSPLEANGLSDNFISAMVEDEAGFIWIATRNGLNRLNPKTEEFKVFLPEPGNPKSISYRLIRTLYVDSQQTLWIGTGFPWGETPDGGLNRYHPETETFTRYLHDPEVENSISNNKITAIFEDSNNNFWIGTGENGVHLMDRDKGTFEYHEMLSNWDREEEHAHIRSFFELENGTIWLCSYGCGLKNYDPKTDKMLDYIYNKSEDAGNQFPPNWAWRIYQSDDQTLWFCTGDVGEKICKSNRLMPFLGMVWSGDRIQAIVCNKENGNIWLGRQYNGLNFGNWSYAVQGRTWYDDPKEQRDGNWWSSEDMSSEQLFDNIFTLYEDAENWLWFGKWQEAKGLYRFNPKTGEIKNFKHEANNPNGLAGNIILHITGSTDGKTVWIITENEVLHRYDLETGQFKQYAATDYSGCPDNPEIAHFSKDGQLWVGSVEGQKEVRLTLFEPEEERFTSYTLLTLENSDNTFAITNIETDQEGGVWMSTEKAIFHLTKERQVKHHPLEDVKIGSVEAMIWDRQQGLWLATTTGISVFNMASSEVFTFPLDYQIPAMPFSLRAATMLGEEFVFCGKGGCLFINYTTIANYYGNLQNTKKLDANKILLTSFLLNGKEIKEGKYDIDSILVERKLVLNHVENNFSFELSLLDFQLSEYNHFEYFLENYDQYWRKTGDKNTAYYSQIPPGKYRFRVRGYNVMGDYGEAMPVDITILPPWWRTWWAYTLYGLLVVGLLLGIYRFQIKRQLAEAENQRLQDLDMAKSQLYTNITHEFRTPLTVILGMAKQLEGQVTESQNLMVEMIGRNGQNLLNLVNQMLDLAKVESGQMTLQLQQSDIISYLKYLTESFHSFAESRGVKVHFLSDLESQLMDFDPHKIQQIFSNLVSNAIKFTPYSGDIYISVQPLSEKREKLSIKIKDTGIGIEESRLPHIFQRFYQVDDSATKAYQGTGIGLALVAELVKLMGGKIDVKSELGKGTAFTILLPIEQNAEQNLDLSHFAAAKTQFFREGIADDLQSPPVALNKKDQRPTLLVVEDNFDVRTYIRACLGDRFEVMMAENGQRGVERAIEIVPDLIISDVMMPVKDGYSLARELKADKRTSHIPIILLTAKADTDSKLTGLQQGVDAYLAKPFNPKELHIRIQKLLELRKKLQQYYLSLSTGESPTTDSENNNQTTPQEDEFVQEVKKVILNHLDNYELDVALLCREIGMSHSQLHRKLSALTGLSTNRFIRHIRLSKAKELLRNPEVSITAVALDTGYSDPSYFGRVFKKETGMTPVEWQSRG